MNKLVESPRIRGEQTNQGPVEAPIHILHLEDNASDAEFVRAVLEDDGLHCSIDRVASKNAFEEALLVNSYDLILSDFSMPGFDGLGALSRARALRPEVPFMFLSGTIGEERAIDSLRQGAVDYILKDRTQRLSAAILRARNDALEREERKKGEAKIRQQAELLNEAQDAIYVRDLDQRITYWNKAAEQIYGWTSEEVIGRQASNLLYKADAPSRQNIWKEVLEKGKWVGELQQIKKDGSELYVASRRTLLRDPNGSPLAVLNINTDITEKKLLETQLLRSQRVDTIGALAGGIAHDLNNVLAPILMASELMRDKSEDAENNRMLDLVKKSAQRGTELVKQIVQFARGSRQEQVLDVKSLIEDLATLAVKTFPRTITLQTDVRSNLLPVIGDATHFHQILLNLCVNARDAMPQGGYLTVAAKNTVLTEHMIYGGKQSVSGSFVELSVSDTGTGIPPEVLSRMFEPFFTTKEIGKGTGLGLATVATIVQKHRGFLDVSTVVGKGTTFRIFLPPGEIKSQNKEDASQDEPINGEGEWILLVDDEHALLEMTKELLQAHNYQVITASNGREALGCFQNQENAIAAVITDLHMPELSGEELISNLVKQFPQAVTICLSGSEAINNSKDHQTAAHAFLRKPCATKDLLFTLRKLLSKQHTDQHRMKETKS